MGDLCNPSNLLAAVRAANKIEGQDLRSDADITANFDDKQKMAYERVLGKHFAGMAKKSPYDIGEVEGSKKRITTDDHTSLTQLRAYQPPSQTLGNEFYDQIADLHRKFESKTFDNSKLRAKAFKNDIVKPVQKIMTDLEGLVKKHNKEALKPILKEKYGIELENVYDAYDWLKWISEGGHTINDKNNFLKKPSVNLAGSMARVNITWTIGNIADVSRIVGAYLDKPESLAKGLSKTFFESGPLGAFRRTKDLEDAGLYKTGEGTERGDFGNHEPFSWSTTMQKNLAFHLDKADGGDGFTGVRTNSFDYDPWDRAPVFRNDTANNLVFGLARFPIAEALWHINTVKRAVKGDKNAGLNLLSYAVAKSAIFGTASLVPSFIYAALPNEQKQEWRKIDKHIPFANLIGKGANSIAGATGADTDIEFSSFAQPFGGNLGSRVQAIGRTFQEAPQSATKALENLGNGDISEASLNSFAAAIAVANLTGLPSGFMGTLRTPVNTLINNTTTKKVVKSWAKSLEEEHGQERTSRETWKAVLGSGNVRKGKKKTGSFGKFSKFGNRKSKKFKF